MKITKLGHSCLLVEMPDRTALFDPGSYSEVDVDSLKNLDDIIITHEHGDHVDVDLVKRLQAKFPNVRIKAASSVTSLLNEAGLKTMQDTDEGVVEFNAPHETVEPLFPTPENMGVHYLDRLTHPGDSLQFDETKAILALPVTAPWGATVDAVKLALKLKPLHIIPIHDWHWNEDARKGMYAGMAQVFDQAGIKFLQVENGQPITIDV